MMKKYFIIFLSLFCFVAVESSATMTNLCDNGLSDTWNDLTDWSPYPAPSLPTSSTNVVLGGGTGAEHNDFITSGVNAVCSNLTFGASCKPHIKSGGSLHVYGDILNAYNPEPWIEGGSTVTVDGVVNDSNQAQFIVEDGGTFTVNGTGTSYIVKIKVYGTPDISIPGGLTVGELQLYDDGLLFTNDITLENFIMYSQWQSGSLTGEVSGTISYANNIAFRVRTDTTLILSGVITNTAGDINANDPVEFSGTRMFTGQNNSYSEWLYSTPDCKFFLNDSNSKSASFYINLADGSVIGGTSTSAFERIQDQSPGGTIDPGYNTGLIGTFGSAANGWVEIKSNTTLNIDIDGTGAGTNDLLVVANNFNLYEGCIINFNQVGTVPDDGAYVFAEYGALPQQAYFSVTNNLPSSYDIDYNYQGSNQIALVFQASADPAIVNDSPTGIGATDAYFNGMLLSTGGSECVVSVYYGTNNGGTVISNWQFEVELGTNVGVPPVGYSTNITGLTMGATYFYRYYVTNATTNAWAPTVESFHPSLVITQMYNGDVSGAWGNATNWSPQTTPQATNDIVIGDTDYEQYNLVADWFFEDCAFLTWGAANEPRIASFGTLHVHADYYNAQGGIMRVYGGLTVDGSYYDKGRLIVDGGMFNNSSSERAWIDTLDIYGGSEAFISGGVYIDTELYLRRDFVFTNHLTLGGQIEYNHSLSETWSGMFYPDIDLNGGERTILVDAESSLSFVGSVTNGDLTTGNNAEFSGKIILLNENGYGDLTVRSSPVFLNGTNRTSGTITVQSAYAGLLGGSGDIYKDVIVQSNTVFNPGPDIDVIGTYTATGKTVTINVGGTMAFELAAAGNADRVNVGTLTITGATIDMDIIGGLGLDDPEYILAEYGTLNGIFGVTNGLPMGYSIDYNYQSSNRIALYYSANSNDIVIASLPPTNVTPESAWLNGTVLSTGTSACAVSLFWGDNNGGTNATNWDYEISCGAITGSVPQGVTKYITGLEFGKTYYYTFYGTNASTNIWSSPIQSFRAGGIDGLVHGGRYGLLDEDRDLDLDGDFLYAIKGGDREPFFLAPTGRDIGGQTFVGCMTGDGPYPPTNGPAGFTNNIQHAWNPAPPTGLGLSDNLKLLLGHWGYKHDNGSTPLSLRADVAPGSDYKMQLMWHNPDQGSFPFFDLYVDDVLIADDLHPFEDIKSYNTAFLTNAMMYSYTFKATGSVVNIELRKPGVEDPRCYYSAFTLENFDLDLPEIENKSPTDVMATSGTMNGMLYSTGTSETAVFLAYGNADRGTNRTAWAQEVSFGAVSSVIMFPVSYATNITGLVQGATYYYRYFATNSTGIYWSRPMSLNYWGPGIHAGDYTLLDEDSDLDLDGDFLYAIKGGDRNKRFYTNGLPIGGVTFYGCLEGDGPYPPTLCPSGFTNNIEHSQNTDRPTGSGLSVNLKWLLADWGYKNDNGTPLSLRADVTPGSDYKMQLMWHLGSTNGFNYQRAFFDIYVDDVLVADDLYPHEDIQSYNTAFLTNGMMYSYVFTATGSLVNIELRQPVPEEATCYYSAFTLETYDTDLPEVLGASATNVTATNAWLNGTVLSLGASSSVDVWAYWGDNDAEEAGWDNSKPLGSFSGLPPLSMTTLITGLTDGVTYYYRFYATNESGTAWSGTWSLNKSSALRKGLLSTVADLSDIDLDGEILYAINCGQEWYTGWPPPGGDPFADDVWGSTLEADSELTVKGVTFKGDIWNYHTNAAMTNSIVNFGIAPPGDKGPYQCYTPQRFAPYAPGDEGYTFERTGYQTPKTNACPYEWSDWFGESTGVFGAGVDEDNMEKILGKTGRMNNGWYRERDCTWHFDVKAGGRYKLQMIFYKPSGTTGTRVEVQDELCFDGLNVTNELSDPENEALLWSYVFTAESDVVDVRFGRDTEEVLSNVNNISAITIERLAPEGSLIMVW